MASTDESAGKVTPAQLTFLAIYSPALGETDETFRDQIVFYHSKDARLKRRHIADEARREAELREEENEKLRQIGLAQGTINFAKSFSNGNDVEAIDTEKSRIVLKELEKGWWILASVELTQIRSSGSSAEKSSREETKSAVTKTEYSAREVSPPELLLKQLLQAYRVFLLHHGASLSDMYVRLNRSKFCGTLDRFWEKFASTWDVMLHGSPAVDMFGGIKLAAGGELGMGVGEEEWGSGEREVLEDFTSRTGGLVDLIVGRYGEPAAQQESDKKSVASKAASYTSLDDLEPWMGSGHYAGASDGIVYGGCGAISRNSVRDISHWMEWLYAYGEQTYGVKDNPSSARRKGRRRERRQPSSERPPLQGRSSTEKTIVAADARMNAATRKDLPPGIPRPIVSAVEQSLDKASNAAESTERQGPSDEQQGSGFTDPEAWKYYLSFGYGGSLRGQKPKLETQESREIADLQESAANQEPATMSQLEPRPHLSRADRLEASHKAQIQKENGGYWIIGLQGDLEDDTDAEEDTAEASESAAMSWNGRVMLRTLYADVVRTTKPDYTEGTSNDSPDGDSQITPRPRNIQRLRTIVYVHRPFIYTFLFEVRAESLSIPSFFRHLHTYFSPLHRPLSASTSPLRVAARIAAASPSSPAMQQSAADALNKTSPNPIFDLVYDPQTLTVHCTLPNIPEPGTAAAKGLVSHGRVGDLSPAWGRVEALNIHSHILTTIASTRTQPNEIERTSQTARGWWIVWMRLRPSDYAVTDESGARTETLREAEEQADKSNGSTDGKSDHSMSSKQALVGQDDNIQGRSTTTDPNETTPDPGALNSSSRRTKKSSASLAPLRHGDSQDSEESFVPSVSPPATVKNAHLPRSDSEIRADNPGQAAEVERVAGPKTADVTTFREAFLVRRSASAMASKSGSSNSGSRAPSGGLAGFRLGGMGMGNGQDTSGHSSPGRRTSGQEGLAGMSGMGGIGFDARRYVEGLLSLNR